MFLFAIIATLAWGFADLFYKKGNDEQEKYSHLKTVVSVGTVMGILGVALQLFGYEVSFSDIITYLPVSALYIVSMAVGYFGLRYLFLSISSPIQNSSGALVAILCFFLGTAPNGFEIAGTASIALGIILLAIFEKSEKAEKKTKYGALALIFPLAYCMLDAAGTFLDGLVLDEWESVSSDAATVAYFYTFFAAAVVCFIIVTIKEKRVCNPFSNKDRLIASGFETGGQVFYILAMTEKAYIAAPLIASYCAVSVLLSRLFLKEKPSVKQYIAILIVFAGVLLFGINEMMIGMNEV